MGGVLLEEIRYLSLTDSHRTTSRETKTVPCRGLFYLHWNKIRYYEQIEKLKFWNVLVFVSIFGWIEVGKIKQAKKNHNVWLTISTDKDFAPVYHCQYIIFLKQFEQRKKTCFFVQSLCKRRHKLHIFVYSRSRYFVLYKQRKSGLQTQSAQKDSRCIALYTR